MNRATLAELYAASPQRTPWKTFVVEAHAEKGAEHLLKNGFGQACVQPTEDIYLHHLVGDVDFIVDHLDNRFWSFHTSMPSTDAEAYLRRVVGARNDLDWMWLPSGHLSNVWHETSLQWLAVDYHASRLSPSKDPFDDLQVQLRVRGNQADEVLRVIEKRYRTVVPQGEVGISARDPEFGWVNERINHQGRFMANGDDFNFHQSIVRHMVGKYRRFVEAVEQRSLCWRTLPGGGARLSGVPVTIKFSKQISDIGLFVESLFSSREPFRLWGLYELVGDHGAEVEAVDLHIGQQLRFDVMSDCLRVYVFEGGCGNTVARLASNLQRHYDGALSIVDDELQALMSPGQ